MKLKLTIPQNPGFMHALPVLDLLVLILVIPFLTSTLMPEEGMAVELPETSFRMQRIDQPIVVTISISEEGPEIWVGRTRLGEELMEDVLIRKQEERKIEGVAPVLLRVDQKVPSGYQLQCVDRIKKAGFQKVYLSTQNPG